MDLLKILRKIEKKRERKKKWSIEGDFNFKSVAIKVCEKQPVLKGEIYSARKKKRLGSRNKNKRYKNIQK